MRTSKFTAEQITHAPPQAEGGTAVAELCRELGITEPTFYRWKRKYHGISTPGAARAASAARGAFIKRPYESMALDSTPCSHRHAPGLAMRD